MSIHEEEKHDDNTSRRTLSSSSFSVLNETVRDPEWYTAGSIWSTSLSQDSAGSRFTLGSFGQRLDETSGASARFDLERGLTQVTDAGSIGTTESGRGNTRARMWLATVLNYNVARPLSKEMFRPVQVTAITGQYEICPDTGTRHIHMAIEFGTTRPFNAVKKHVCEIFGVPSCNLKMISAASWETVCAYCQKEESRDEMYAHFAVDEKKLRFGREVHRTPYQVPIQRQQTVGRFIILFHL